MTINRQNLNFLYQYHGVVRLKIEKKSSLHYSAGNWQGDIFIIEFASEEDRKNFFDRAKVTYLDHGYSGQNLAYKSDLIRNVERLSHNREQQQLWAIEIKIEDNKLCTQSNAEGRNICKIANFFSKEGIAIFGSDCEIVDKDFAKKRILQVQPAGLQRKKKEITHKENNSYSPSSPAKDNASVKIENNNNVSSSHHNQAIVKVSQSAPGVIAYNLTLENTDQGEVMIRCRNQEERDKLLREIFSGTNAAIPTTEQKAKSFLEANGLGIYCNNSEEAKCAIYIHRTNYKLRSNADSDTLRSTPLINHAIPKLNAYLPAEQQLRGDNGSWQVPESLSKTNSSGLSKGPFIAGATVGAGIGITIAQQVGLFGLVAGVGLFSSVLVAKVVAVAAILTAVALPALALGVLAYSAYGLFSKYSSCKRTANKAVAEESSGCSLFSSCRSSSQPN